jgi:hypothetical protein
MTTGPNVSQGNAKRKRPNRDGKNLNNPPTPELRKRLMELNEVYCVVRLGGETMVLHEYYDPALREDTIEYQRMASFVTFYESERYRQGDETVSLGAAWRSWPERRQYDGVIFDPAQPPGGKRGGGGYFNLWRGFGVQPDPDGDWSLYDEHLRENICGGDPLVHEFVLDWMAHAVQRPDEPPGVALVLRSDLQGVGKNTFAEGFAHLFGCHGRTVENAEQVVGRFNDVLERTVLLFLDEQNGFSKKAASALRSIITGKTLSIESKGLPVRKVANRCRVIIAGHGERIISAGLGERRFLVLEVAPNRCQDKDYFDAIWDQLKGGGFAGMLHDLQRRDVSGFHLRTPPNTAAMDEQKLLGLDPKRRWWFEILQRGFVFSPSEEWGEVDRDALAEDFMEAVNAGRFETETKHGALTSLGAFLKKVFADAPGWPQDPRPLAAGKGSAQGPRKYRFPPLARCRELFDAEMRWKRPWPEPLRAAPGGLIQSTRCANLRDFAR